MTNLGKIIDANPGRTIVPGVKNVFKITYQSEDFQGKPRLTSGLVFVPKNLTAGKAAKILAWAHGTVGMSQDCAPSRQKDPGLTVPNLRRFMQLGLVVCATDYAGLGTEGVLQYLVGNSEANDVLNCVRAVKNLTRNETDKNFLMYGHSQGGHSVLFAARKAAIYAKELNLLGVVALAPAVKLTELLEKQKNEVAAWMIGPEIVVSWQSAYPKLNIKEILSDTALKNYERLAYKKIEATLFECVVRTRLGQRFFKIDPVSNTTLALALKEQTPKVVLKVPIFICQGLKDNLVIPETTRSFVNEWKKLGAEIMLKEFPKANHISLPRDCGSEVVKLISTFPL